MLWATVDWDSVSSSKPADRVDTYTSDLAGTGQGPVEDFLYVYATETPARLLSTEEFEEDVGRMLTCLCNLLNSRVIG